MSFLFPGWYLIEYGAGTDTKQITGFIEGGTDVGGLASFVRVESSDAHGNRVRHIQVGLIQSMEEMATPGKKTEEKPAEKETKPTERTETNFPPAASPLPLAVRVDWVCGECEHSLYRHNKKGVCLDEDSGCACKLDSDAYQAFFALDAQARLRGIQERARVCVETGEVVTVAGVTPDQDAALHAPLVCRECGHKWEWHGEHEHQRCGANGCTCPFTRKDERVFQNVNAEEPQKVESEPLPSIENEEQMAANFRKVCKWCHHSQVWHPVGDSMTATCGMAGCLCPVLRGDPAFREAEEKKEEQKPAATEQSKLKERLGDYLVKMADALGISREPFITIANTLSSKAEQPQKDTLASFEQALGEARADVLRGTADQWTAPVFRFCVDCGDPWMWHQSERGGFCHAHDCNCQNLRTQEERFVPEET